MKHKPNGEGVFGLRDTSREAVIKSAVRAAVRDHWPRDPMDLPFEPVYAITRTEAVKDRVWQQREIREQRRESDCPPNHHATGKSFSDQRRRTAYEILLDPVLPADDCGPWAATAIRICGNANDLEPKYGSRDNIVVRIRYAETWVADYEVGPYAAPRCWQD